MAQVTLDGLFAQDECRGDLAVTLGERQQTQDFYLAPGQTAKGTPGEATCRVRSRRWLIAGKREAYEGFHSHIDYMCGVGLDVVETRQVRTRLAILGNRR